LASEKKTETEVSAATFQCQEYQLTQMYYRGNQGWVRNVPISEGKEQWSKSEPFRMFVDLNVSPSDHPGSGEVKDISYRFYSAGQKTELSMVRGGSFFVKVFSNQTIGVVDWSTESKTGWITVSDSFPDVQAYGSVSIRQNAGDNQVTHFYDTLYQGNKGYLGYGYIRFSPLLDDIVERNNAEYLPKLQKSLVIDLNTNPSAIPGSGSVQAIGDYVSQDNTVLNQTWYRGNIGYMRQVPVRDFKPDYKSATPIQVVVDLKTSPTALPGSGEMQANANFINCKR
jgi:hypothetical protein